MQQREFTATKTIYLSDDDFYIRPADICVHTEPTNKLAVYRNQEGVGVFNRSLTSVMSMVAAGWLTETEKTPTAAPVVVEEPKAEAPAPVEVAPVEVAAVEPVAVEAVAPVEVAAVEPVVTEEAPVEEPAAEEEAPAEEPKQQAGRSKKGSKK